MFTDDHQTLAAITALLLWPIANLLIFAVCKNFSRGLIWSILGAQLLLPVDAAIKFQMVPPIDKVTIANFCALAGCVLFRRSKPLARQGGFGLVEWILILTIAGPVVTSVLNSDDIVIGDRFLPGVGIYDALSAAEAALIAVIPFMLGRRFLSAASDCEEILRILAFAGLCYSIPLLFEVRFSPQLHYWVYGYYPSEFVQSMREDGFRPMVFMGHGLAAAFFLMTSIIAATALWRNKVKIGSLSPGFVVSYLSVVLFLCKSLGALIYGIFGGLVVLSTKPRTQTRLAAIFVTISLMYPTLRSLDLFPTRLIYEVARSISLERADSLKYRFDNEDILLERANQRPLVGWGRFGRSRVYDPESGKDLSVTDGRWIIDLGQFGLIGFLSEFGLLSICVYRAALALRLVQSAEQRVSLAALALILAINILDLLPNSGLIPWTWLIAGALIGRAEALIRARRAAQPNLHRAISVDIQSIEDGLQQSHLSPTHGLAK